MNIIKQPGAYILSHNGLGDYITMIGAVRFLSNYYDTIYFLCKDIFESNVKLLFKDLNVITIPFLHNDEFEICKNIINNAKENNMGYDFFICGMHNNYASSIITHPVLLSYNKNDKMYTNKYSHIKDFYYDIHLDLSIYYDYFQINSTNESKTLYEEINNYNIIFMHTKSSDRELDLIKIISEYIHKKDYIIICANKNIYDSIGDYEIKKNICNKYVNIPIAHYIDIIKEATYIHVIDSCFSCIIYPLAITNKLKSKQTIIYNRTIELDPITLI